jgi:hypothetical protein
MTKTFSYRLFGVGKIPETLLTQLQNEKLLLQDEGIRGSVTYRNFHSPGRYANWQRQWYTSSIALTKARLIGLRHSAFIINVPLTDERLRSMRFQKEDDGALLVAFDASLFHNDWSGTIEYRFRTPLAQNFIDMLHQLIV